MCKVLLYYWRDLSHKRLRSIIVSCHLCLYFQITKRKWYQFNKFHFYLLSNELFIIDIRQSLIDHQNGSKWCPLCKLLTLCGFTLLCFNWYVFQLHIVIKKDQIINLFKMRQVQKKKKKNTITKPDNWKKKKTQHKLNKLTKITQVTPWLLGGVSIGNDFLMIPCAFEYQITV